MTKVSLKKIVSFIHEKRVDVDRFFNKILESVEVSEVSDTLLLCVETGGTEGIFKNEVLPNLGKYKRLIIVASEYANSLPASLEIKTFMKMNKPDYPVFLLHGNAIEVLKRLNNPELNDNKPKFVYQINGNLNLKKKLGVIGKPSDWLIASIPSYSIVKEKFGIDLIDIDYKELVDQISLANEGEVLSKNVNLSLYIENDISKDMKTSLKILGALQSIVEKYNLDGFTIRCFDLLNIYKGTSCFAVSYLNKQGIVSTCEGDISSLITMMVIRNILNKPSFQANSSSINIKSNSVVLAHCAVPFDMCEDLKYPTHFESNLGIGVKGKLKEEYGTIFKVSPALDEFLFIEGKIIRNLDKQYLCKTQIEFELNEYKPVELFSANVANHIMFFYGDGNKIKEILQ